MAAQRLIAAIEGCSVEPEQSEMLFADQPRGARSALPAGGLKLVLSARNCPEDSIGPVNSSDVREFIRTHFPH